MKSLEKIVENLLDVLQECSSISQLDNPLFDEYRKTCHRILKDIDTKCLKIAVAGAIKSGKSTFINSLLGKDLVQRGAGVVTSITTRIRKGKKNRANLYFKSWDSVNLQLSKALESFPEKRPDLESDAGEFTQFDIRRKKDRAYLQTIFKTLTSDFPVTKKGIQPETLLIKHALHGFDRCKNLVKPDENSLLFESKSFNRYKEFISDPDNAFYIKDVCLEVYGKTIDPGVEIADCQGADSTDPGQLAHILNYIEASNLVIYCISSRTGLRHADIVFLNHIKQLGLLHNIIFINNCDFTEHENFEDLIKVEKSIIENLEFLEIKPQIFSLSSLYNLFKVRRTKLNKKDSIRFKLWQEEKKSIVHCDLQTREFQLFFQDVIDKKRYNFLISNHFNRLDNLIASLLDHTDLFLNLLSSDKEKEAKAVENLTALEKNTERLEPIVTNYIDRCLKDLKEQVHKSVQAAFLGGRKTVLNDLLNFVNNRVVFDVEQYKTTTRESFNQILYLMFQDFKRQLDLYVIENVKPEFKKFINLQEKEITSYFQSLFNSFQIDLTKDTPFFQMENTPGVTIQYDAWMTMETIRKILNLKLPLTIFDARYTSKIKANVFTDFSIHTLSGILFSLFRKNRMFSFSPGLNKAAEKIKKENMKLIKIQYKQIYINLENEYFIPLIEALSRDFKEKTDEYFTSYHSYRKEVQHVFSLKQSEKETQRLKIHAVQREISEIADSIALTAEF